MSGQIVDVSLIAAFRQHNTQEEKKAVKEGRFPDEWKDKPAKRRQKGSGRSLNGEGHESQAARRWLHAAGRYRHSGLWLSEPHLD
jgi:hypothetical protein